MSLRIVSQFATVTVLDCASQPRRRFGVPSGGALDTESLALAKLLVGRDSEVIEVVGGSIELVATEDCSVGIVGAELVDNGQCRMNLAKDETLSLKLGARGFAYYIATGPVLLPIRLAEPPSSLANDELLVLPGPQHMLFESQILDQPFTVTNELSRVGVRLKGPFADHAYELRSEPACHGAIQVTPNGTTIILGPDGPTIGGYPKIAVVCSADLPKVGQLRPGQTVRLRTITLEEAHARRQAKADELKRQEYEFLIADRR